jgi:hypothetical protein
MPRCRKWISMAFRHLETSLHRFHKSRFLIRPGGRLWVHSAIRLLKRILSDFVKVAFSMSMMQKIGSHGLSTSRNIASSNSPKSFFKPSRRLRAIWQLKTSLKRLRPSRFFRCARCRKWVGMTIWHLETSFHRIHQSRYLRRLEDKLKVLRAIRLLKTSLTRLCPSRLFRCSGCRKRVRIAFRHLETSLQRIHQRRF